MLTFLCNRINTSDLAVGTGGFLAMNLLPQGDLLNNWAGGGGVIAGGGPPGLSLFLSYVIPAVIGSYVMFGAVMIFFFRRGIIHFG